MPTTNTITKKLLHEVLQSTEPTSTYEDYVLNSWIEDEDKGERLTEEAFAAIQRARVQGDIKMIIADRGMSENHIGGDDVVSIVDGVLEAVRDGFEVITWYGDETEVLIVGIKRDKVSIAD